MGEVRWRNKDGSVVLPSKAVDIARPVNELYHTQIAPTITPLATEQWISIPPSVTGIPVRIVGKIDVIKQGAGKVDLKFGGSAVKSPRPDWLLQADIYNLADDTPFEWHSASWGNDRYGVTVNTPANAPALLKRSTPEDKAITLRLVRSLTAAIVAYYRMFGPDEPWPGNGRSHQWACSFCPFHPEHGHRRLRLPAQAGTACDGSRIASLKSRRLSSPEGELMSSEGRAVPVDPALIMGPEEEPLSDQLMRLADELREIADTAQQLAEELARRQGKPVPLRTSWRHWRRR